MDDITRIDIQPFDISRFPEPEEIILVTVTPDSGSTIPEIGQGCRARSPQGYTVYGKVVSVDLKTDGKVELGMQCKSRDITTLFTEDFI